MPEDAVIPKYAEFVWQAFWHLHSDRQMMTVGTAIPMGATVIEPRPGLIPFTAIDRYAERFEIQGELFNFLLELLRKMDREYAVIETEKARERRRG